MSVQAKDQVKSLIHIGSARLPEYDLSVATKATAEYGFDSPFGHQVHSLVTGATVNGSTSREALHCA